MKKILYILMVLLMLTGFFGVYHVTHAQYGLGTGIGSGSADAARAREQAVANAAAQKAASGVTPCINWGGAFGAVYPVGINIGSCVAELFNLVVLRAAAMFLWVAGWFFNYTLQFSLNMGQFLTQVPIVDIGWKIFRDVANLCFIFILLYIAITTILQSKGSDAKRLLIRVIIVALLLNFSLFMAKVVIDSSNILALQFYQKMGGEETSGPFAKIDNASGAKGISQTLLKGLGLEGIYQSGGAVSGGGEVITFSNVLSVSIGGALLIMITAFVLFAAAIMFIIRTVVLIFLMILAPLAFLSMVLPQTEGYWKKWLSMLLNQSFFAPLYLMLIYLVVAIVSGQFGGDVAKGIPDSVNLGTFLTGNGSAVGTLYVFIVLIALMMGSLLVAKSLGAMGGDFARNWAGKATFGVSSWIGRQTAGRLAQKAAKSDFVGKLRNSTGFAAPLRSVAGAVDKTAAGSFDIRSSGIGKAAAGSVGGLGTATGEGGFKKMSEEDKKRKVEYQKIVTAGGKTKELEDALKVTDGTRDEKIRAALYKFSDNEYAELGGDKLTNADIIRNSKPSQIAHVTDEKFDKLRVDQKKKISETRGAPLTGLFDPDKQIDVANTNDVISRFNSLTPEAQDKLINSSAGNIHTAFSEIKSGNIAAATTALGAVAGSSVDSALLVSDLKTAQVKGELGKFTAKEKSKMDIEFLSKHEEILRNLDGDTLKAIEARDDLPPAMRDLIKNKRHDLLKLDLDHANDAGAKELLKGLKASDLIKIVGAKDSSNVAKYVTRRPVGGAVGSGSANSTLVSLLTIGQLKDLENEGLPAEDRKAIGDQIRNSGTGNAYDYVKATGKGFSAWS